MKKRYTISDYMPKFLTHQKLARAFYRSWRDGITFKNSRIQYCLLARGRSSEESLLFDDVDVEESVTLNILDVGFFKCCKKYIIAGDMRTMSTAYI